MITKYALTINKAERQILNKLLKQYIDNETRDLIDGPTVYESNTPIDLIITIIGECTKLWLFSSLNISKQQVTLEIPQVIHTCVQSILLREAQRIYPMLLDRSQLSYDDKVEMMLINMTTCERLHERLKHSKVIN